MAFSLAKSSDFPFLAIDVLISCISCSVAIFLELNTFCRSAMYPKMWGFVKFSAPMNLAVLSEYPALTAAAVAFPPFSM